MLALPLKTLANYMFLCDCFARSPSSAASKFYEVNLSQLSGKERFEIDFVATWQG